MNKIVRVLIRVLIGFCVTFTIATFAVAIQSVTDAPRWTAFVIAMLGGALAGYLTRE